MRSAFAENCLLPVGAFYRSRVRAETNCMKANSFSITYENFVSCWRRLFHLNYVAPIKNQYICNSVILSMHLLWCNARCHRLKERALWEYRAKSWAKAFTPSAKLCYVRPFPGLLFSFFPIIESEISEQASRQVAIEEPEENRRTLLKREQIRKSSKEKQNRHSEF